MLVQGWAPAAAVLTVPILHGSKMQRNRPVCAPILQQQELHSVRVLQALRLYSTITAARFAFRPCPPHRAQHPPSRCLPSPYPPYPAAGFPSVGKSTLLNKMTGTFSEVAAYEFTTLTCVPGIIRYRGAKIQLLDLPGIIEGAKDGKGRGRQVSKQEGRAGREAEGTGKVEGSLGWQGLYEAGQQE